MCNLADTSGYVESPSLCISSTKLPVPWSTQGGCVTGKRHQRSFLLAGGILRQQGVVVNGMGSAENRLKVVLATFSAMLVVGCSSKLAVSYGCDPVGATLYQNSNLSSVQCPTVLYYPITDDDEKRGVMKLSGFTARWVSGASVSVSYITADLNKHGLRQSYNFIRPVDAPNIELDVQYAIEYQRNLLKQQELDQANDEAISAALLSASDAVANARHQK
jgi:hypothetical protein